jgi:predicted glycogen debranching enzyme
MGLRFAASAEWLEPDGLGGFASGTVDGIRTRRYHALLLVATTPPTGRFVLVNGVDAFLETAAGRFALTSQRYRGDVVSPDGASSLVDFEPRPWPRWRWRLPDGTEVEQELLVPHRAPMVALAWRRVAGSGSARLTLRPFLSGRDYHSLHHENPAFRFAAMEKEGRVSWRPYADVPGVVAVCNGRYEHAPDWYRSFLYTEERERGLDCEEDLATPGWFECDLGAREAVLLLATEGAAEALLTPGTSAEGALGLLRSSENRRRRRFPTPLHQSAASYLVRRGNGHTLIAGYPWFTDWGRDTFVALRGLCLATGQLDVARDILLEWADTVSEGMLPNRFPDQGSAPEFNAVDASLWFVVAAQEYLDLAAFQSRSSAPRGQRKLLAAMEAILEGYAAGTRYGIQCDEDGLLRAGQPGVQLTWMDARVGERVVTPRCGKPVEVQALWLNALRAGARISAGFGRRLERGLASFRKRFWCDATGCLYDVIDVDHVAGAVDETVRPNQIFAVGGLPLALLDGDRARQVVDVVERRLLVPLALRSLAPDASGYVGRYEGDSGRRDGAYHQGTAWPWLLGPFVEAWLRVRGSSPAARREARTRFLEPLQSHLCEAGLGHVSEILDGEPPHRPRGCPFQAWSLGEILRLELQVLAAGDEAP